MFLYNCLIKKLLESAFTLREQSYGEARSECIWVICYVRQQIVEDMLGVVQNCSEWFVVEI